MCGIDHFALRSGGSGTVDFDNFGSVGNINFAIHTISVTIVCGVTFGGEAFLGKTTSE